MKSKNKYSYPIEQKFIKEISTTKSPAHRKYKSKNGVLYDLRNAVDFLCGLNTPVKAAFDGEVVAIVDSLKKNHNKWEPPKNMPEEEQDGNYAVLKHKNKELSIYSHLGYRKVLVKKGQKVKTGEVLGYSGSTGWSIKPHLHFMVFKFLKKEPAKDLESLKVGWISE